VDEVNDGRQKKDGKEAVLGRGVSGRNAGVTAERTIAIHLVAVVGYIIPSTRYYHLFTC
jgi:hypothetical protein